VIEATAFDRAGRMLDADVVDGPALEPDPAALSRAEDEAATAAEHHAHALAFVDSLSPGPVVGTPAGMREGEDHDAVILDLIRDREREAIERCDPPVGPMLPLRCCPGEPQDPCEDFSELILELHAEAGHPGLVVVDLVVDLGDRQPMKAEVHRRARAPRAG
jgi:hypothetical protein